MKIIHTADWHLGHNKTPTKHICDNIIKYLFPYVKQADILFFVGDLLDRSISMNSNDAYYVIDLLYKLFQLCQDNNTIIRILKGTHHHDKYQLETLSALFEQFSDLNIKYFNTMSYEYIDELNISCYYLPDNLPYSSLNTIVKKINSDLNTYNVQKVDYLLCHGVFDFCKIPIKKNLLVYIYDIMERFVNKYMLLGHIHTHMTYKKAIYCGSFDKLSHADIDNKGFIYIEDDIVNFIPNENTMKFETISIPSSLQDDNIFNLLDKFILHKFDKISPYGYLRCIIDKKNNSYIKTLIKKYIHEHYPKINISFKITDSDIQDESEYISLNMESHIEQLNKLNEKTIVNIIYNNLKDKYQDIQPQQIEQILKNQN